jgi:prostaglandin-H2 D-isomerase / glutathione transferase
MSRPRLTYFDAPVSRGEECRLALWLGGIEFDDNRVKPADWPALKPKTPYGGMPTLEVPERGILAQSNAILVYVGRRTGLHPTDLFEAARHEAMLCHCEDLRSVIGTTLRMPEADKKAAREAMAATTIPAWAAATEAQIGDGPFFGGATLSVVDLKLHMMVRWLAGGKLDHIPATILAPYPKLNRLHDAVRDDDRVKAWYARS